MDTMKQYKRTDKATGIVYVYEGEQYWDKEKKQARWRNRHIVGHVDPDNGEVAPNRPKAKGASAGPLDPHQGIRGDSVPARKRAVRFP